MSGVGFSGVEPVTAPGIHDEPTTPAQAPFTPLQWANIGTAITDRLLAMVLYAVAGIEVFGVKPFDFLRGWADDLTQRANDAYAGALSAQTSANYANSRLGDLSAKTFANAVVGGVALAANFNGPAAGDLGADFTRLSLGSGNGTFGPNGAGVAEWAKLGGVSRIHLDRNNTPLLQDYQIVITVLASLPQAPDVGGQAYNYLAGRINSAQSDLVWVQIGYDSLSLGCYAASTPTTFDSTAFTPAVGDEIRLYLGTGTNVREFVVTRNEEEILRYTDSSAVSQHGVGHLYTGLAAAAADRSFFFDQTVPASLDSWAAADRLATAF